MIERELQKMLTPALERTGYPMPLPVAIETPANLDYGDLATSCAFALAKPLKKSPKLIAEELSQKLNQDQALTQIATISPINGFINFKFTDHFIWSQLTNLLDTPFTFNAPTAPILIEYVSANPTGPLHIGHGRWAALGSAITTLLRYTGHTVKSEFYINDSGNQVQKFYASIDAAKQQKPIPEDGYKGAYIFDLAKQTADPLQTMISSQQATLKRLQVNFDTWYSESQLHKTNKIQTAITMLSDKGHTYTQEGALFFRSTHFGDDKDRVLIKADKSYTYFAVDIAYHLDKLDRGCQKLINIWGADHHGYVSRVKAAVAALSDKNADDIFSILIGQLVSLLRDGAPVKMSKRTGELITLDEVIDEIGSDALRFFLLEKNADTHIEFDLNLAKKQSNENPVYYIQYAHARMASILKKAPPQTDLITTPTLDPAERALACQCLQIDEVIWDAAKNYAPHRLIHYLLATARSFHSFYERCPILKADPETQARRLIILQKTQKTIALGLQLLDIKAPQEM